MFGQAGEMMKMAGAYRKAQKQLKQTKSAGVSSKGTVAVLIDGSMELVDVEIKEGFSDLNPKQQAKEIKSAYKAARKELEKELRKNTSTDDLKEMLGM